MGIPTRIAADEEPLLAAALAAYADWQSPDRGPAGDPLTIRLKMGAAAAALEGDAHCTVQVDGDGLRLEGRGVRGGADAARREAWCTVPADLAADPPGFAAEVLDSLVLFLLTRSGRIPLHAAGILLGDTAILLAGPSGSGKSTLALTADRAGIPLLSEDTVYLQLRPRLRVWGSPRPIHLLPGDVPTESGPGGPVAAPLRHRNGRWKVAVPPRGGSVDGRVAGKAVLCLLERGDELAVRPLAPGLAMERMIAMLDPGFDHFRAELPEALAAITAGGAWTLTLPNEPLHRNPAGPRAAIALLQERLRE